jgi:hypothetical protein
VYLNLVTQLQRKMKYFSAAILTLITFGQCLGQSVATQAFSESPDFNSQVGSYFLTSRKKKNVKSYSLPNLELGEETTANSATISVSVLGGNGNPVNGLRASDFSVTVDGIEAKLQTVEKPNRPPQVIFLLDKSPSSGIVDRVVTENAKALVRGLPPDSVVSLASFSGEFHFKKDQMDTTSAEKEIDNLKDYGNGTSLYDAVVKLGRNPLTMTPDTAIVLVTDGIDTTSTESIARSFGSVEKARAPVYPVYIGSYNTSPASQSSTKKGSTIVPGLGRVTIGPPIHSHEEVELGKMYLNDLAALSGGRPALASTDSTAPFNLGQELSSRFLVTFSLPGKYRLNQRLRIKVKVARPNLVVLSRGTYVVSK